MTERVAIFIDGTQWFGWSDLEMKLSMDAFSTFSFSSPFEPERSEMRAAFVPFSYKPCEIAIGNTTVITGTIVGVEPQFDENSRTVAVSGYALPGILGDVCMPHSAFPIAYRGQTLAQIAQAIASVFGITVKIEGQGSESVPFDLVNMEATQTPFAFLADLAKQRSMIISDTAAGELRLWVAHPASSPVVRLAQGRQPLISAKVSFQSQAYFSEITGMKNANGGRSGAAFTVSNPFLSTPLRPSSFAVEDCDKGDIQGATEAQMGRMFGNCMTVEVELPTWRDPQDALFAPGSTVALHAPGSMIYNETDFQIRDLALKQSGDGTVTSTLGLVLPGVFSGALPTVLPWV